MRATRQDFEAARAEARKRAAKERLPELRSIAQASVAEAKLTGSPEWDGFLKVVQAMRDEAETSYKAFRDQMASDHYLSSDQLVGLKFFVERAAARVAALDDVMSIPSQMRERGEQAIEAMRSVEGA